MRVYEREGYDAESGLGPGGWETLARKWNKGGLIIASNDNVKGRIYRQLHAWRDRIARAEDESTGYATFVLLPRAPMLTSPLRYVLPNRLLFMLAEQPPTDMASLLGMLSHVNPVLRRRLKELLRTIREAQVLESAGSISEPAERTQVNEAVPPEMEIHQTVAATATREPESHDRLWTRRTC